MREQSGGFRQAAWDALRHHDYPDVVSLADKIGGSQHGLRGYIAALEKRGYIDRSITGDIALVRDTGHLAPSWSVHTDEFRDWNIDPAMTGKELARLLKKSGMTHPQFLRALGQAPTNSTRLRQMINGQRPVSSAIADGAKALVKALEGASTIQVSL